MLAEFRTHTIASGKALHKTSVIVADTGATAAALSKRRAEEEQEPEAEAGGGAGGASGGICRI